MVALTPKGQVGRLTVRLVFSPFHRPPDDWLMSRLDYFPPGHFLGQDGVIVRQAIMQHVYEAFWVSDAEPPIGGPRALDLEMYAIKARQSIMDEYEQDCVKW